MEELVTGNRNRKTKQGIAVVIKIVLQWFLIKLQNVIINRILTI